MINIFIVILMQMIAFVGFAQTNQRSTVFNLNKGVAIQGYDPVAYFTDGKPIKGKKDIAIIHKGVTYYFAKPANKEAFLQSPNQYEPQYGGWCAYAMGVTGDKVNIDPETFKIIDGKLFLFYHSWTNNTLTSWNKEERKLKAAADKNWQKIGL